MFDRFQRITLHDRDALSPLLQSFPFVDLGFTALYYCAEAFDICFRFIGPVLCLRIRGEDGVFSYAISNIDGLSDTLKTLVSEEHSQSIRFDFVKAEDIPAFKALPGYACEIDQQQKYSDYFSKYEDYIAVDKQASVHKYKDYNQFLKRYSHEVTELDGSNLKTAEALLERWCASRDCAECTTGCEKEWILRLFNAWNELPAKGLIVNVDGVPESFCILEQNGDTIMRLVCKSPGKQRGLQVFICVESAKRLFPDAKYVNLGPDSGVDGIRQFKDKFRPYTMLDKYAVKLTAER